MTTFPSNVVARSILSSRYLARYIWCLATAHLHIHEHVRVRACAVGTRGRLRGISRTCRWGGRVGRWREQVVERRSVFTRRRSDRARLGTHWDGQLGLMRRLGGRADGRWDWEQVSHDCLITHCPPAPLSRTCCWQLTTVQSVQSVHSQSSADRLATRRSW